MIPIGARVRWRPAIYKSGPLGVVTGYPAPRMVEIDGRGQISVGLLEVVGGMASLDGISIEINAALVAERDALQAVIVQQCEAMADMAPRAAYDQVLGELAEVIKDEREAVERAEKAEAKLKTATDEVTRLEEYAEFAANAADYLKGYMLAIYGECRPVRPIEPVELRRLVEFIFEGA